MKIINRLLILVVIVGGVWFLAKNWNTDTATPTPEENTPAVEEIVTETNTETPIAVEKAVRAPITAPATTPKVDFQKKPVTTQPAKPVTQMTKPTAEPAVEEAVMPADATVVRVYLYEWGVDVSDKTIPAGPVVFDVHNTGKFTHHFAVEGVQDFGKVIPGATEKFTLTLPAADYTLISPREVDTFHEMREDLFVD